MKIDPNRPKKFQHFYHNTRQNGAPLLQLFSWKGFVIHLPNDRTCRHRIRIQLDRRADAGLQIFLQLLSVRQEVGGTSDPGGPFDEIP